MIAVIDGGTDADDRELIRARFNEDPAKDAGPDPARDGRRRRGHRPPAPLPPAGQLRHPVQPQPARAAHRPRRPLRPDAAPEIRHFAPAPRATSAAREDVDLLARVAMKIAQIMLDLGSANEIIAPDIQRQLSGGRSRASAKRTSRGRARSPTCSMAERQVR